MPRRDRENQRAYVAGHYQRNKALYKRRAKASNEAARKRNRDLVREIKMKRGCCNCNFNQHWSALDFHHIDRNTKDKAVAVLSRSSCSVARILREIAKCVVACANCHRLHEAGVISLAEK